jgi:hypothetical protein
MNSMEEMLDARSPQRPYRGARPSAQRGLTGDGGPPGPAPAVDIKRGHGPALRPGPGPSPAGDGGAGRPGLLHLQ